MTHRQHSIGFTRAARATSAIVSIALLAGACAGSSPTGVPSAPPATGISPTSRPPTARPSMPPSPAGPTLSPEQTYAAIQDQVVAGRGLEAKDRQLPTVLDEKALAKELADRFAKDNPAEEIASSEIALKGLGLLPADSSLKDTYLELLTNSVAGFYDPDTKKMYVVSAKGALGPAERITYAHEFTHALQDQHFGLKKLGVDDADNSDRSLARLSLAEGDATLSMSVWALRNMTQAEILSIASTQDPEQAAIVAKMPAILREPLLFPYTSGLSLVQGLFTASNGWSAVDSAYARPPDSTEQVLHPAKYTAAEAPVEVKLPADLATRLGAGWKVADQDTLGELQLRIWLDLAGAGGAISSATASEGWGGDRFAVLTGPAGAWALVLDTAWDSPADATEFETAADAVLAVRRSSGVATMRRDDVIFLAGDDATLNAVIIAYGNS